MNSGKLTTDFGQDDFGQSVTVQADGKILVAGMGNYHFALARYNADGSLDTSFSGDGKLTTDFGGTHSEGGCSVTVQADGKILVAGYSGDDLRHSFALARYNTDGSLDTSFSADGMLTTNISTWIMSSWSCGVTVQADGKILLAGTSDSDFALARYNADGSPDTSFSGDGMLTTHFGWYGEGNSVTVQADGKILVAGYDYNDFGYDFALARYNTDGSLDTSFNGEGKLTTDFSTYDRGNSVTVQADGKILVAGRVDNGFGLARYNTDGSLDTSFSGDGKLVTYFGSTAAYGNSVTVQADGKILVAGGCSGDFALARYNTDGSLDTSFSGDGMLTTDFGSADEFGYSVTVQADGKILLAGGSYGDFALARYNTDGTLDTTFGAAVINHQPTGGVTISGTINGTATQGQTLTAAHTLADVDGLGQISYQWLADGVAITGATGKTLKLAQAQVDKAISVQVSYTDQQGTPESVTSSATAHVVNVNDPGMLAISGAMTQTRVLTATVTDVDGVPDTGVTYQWLANGAAIEGATAKTYTLTQDDVEHQISVVASYRDLQGMQESLSNAATARVGRFFQGSADQHGFDGSAGNDVILAGTGRDRIFGGLGSDGLHGGVDKVKDIFDFNASAESTVGGTRDQIHDFVTTIDQIDLSDIDANITQAGKQKFAFNGTSAEANSIWYRVADADGRAATHDLIVCGDVNGDAKADFEIGLVGVTSVAAADFVTSPATATNDPGAVAISGTATQKQLLTATVIDMDGVSGKVGYQWLADGVAIAGATGRNLTLAQAQVGKAISVQASYTDQLGKTESVTSGATTQVANVNDAGKLAISGAMTQAQVLTATTTDADGVPGAGVTYQWLADGKAITGATAKSYTLTQADIGHKISAVASYRDAHGTQESLTQATTALVGSLFQGSAGKDQFNGTAGNDICFAGTGRDRLVGGLGRDGLHGGADKLKDIFDFNSIAESTVGSARDQIHDFVTTVDQIDLSGIDADTAQTGNQAFAFSGTGAQANSVWYQVADVDGISATKDLIVSGDVNGDAKADFEIGLVGVKSVVAADFVTTPEAALLPNVNDLGLVAVSGTATQKQVLTVTVTDVQGTAERVTSSATAQVANVNDSGKLAISGTATQKQVLTATVTDADGVPSAGVTYQWLADGEAITGATAKTYTLTQGDVGHVISVAASYQDAQGTQESLTQAMTAPMGGFFQGGAGQDIFNGSAGNDVIFSGAGQDRLFGGLGSDSLHGGVDKVKDLFDFNASAESTVGSARDKVHNFVTTIDQIDLADIDADTVQAGDQAFAFSGTGAKAHSLWYQAADVDGSSATRDIILCGDVNGDAKADFEIGLVGVTVIVAADFVL